MPNTSLEKAVEVLRPWHFLVDLGDSTFTIPRYEWRDHFHRIVAQDYAAKKILPLINQLCGAVSEASVLDIGCNEGWFSTLLAREGYGRVVGIDPLERNIQKAEFLKQHFALDNVEYLREGIAEYSADKPFDIAMLFGVLNHVHDPVGVLKKIHSLVGGCLVMDLDLFCDTGDVKENNNRLHEREGVVGGMACHLESPHETTSPGDNLVFQYSEQAVVNMLSYVGFSPVMKVEPPVAYPDHYRKGKRLLIVAHKQPKSLIGDELLLDNEYTKARMHIEAATPKLVAEGISKHNIVRFADYYIAIPQGKAGSFDLDRILALDCMISRDLATLEQGIAAGAGPCASTDAAFIGMAAYELGLQGRYEAALRAADTLPEGDALLRCHKVNTLARVHLRAGNLESAKQSLEQAVAMNPDSVETRALMQHIESFYRENQCHRLFL